MICVPYDAAITPIGGLMLSLIADSSSGNCTLKGKLPIFKDDEVHLATVARLRFEIETAEDALVWEGTDEAMLFPGLQKMFFAVQDPDCTFKWPALKWVPIGGLDTRFSLVPARQEAEEGGVTRHPCSIIHAVAKMTHGGTFVDVLVRFGGIDPDDIKDFLELLRGSLKAEVQSGQTEMFPEEKGEAANG